MEDNKENTVCMSAFYMPVCICVCVFVSARDTVFGLLIGTILWNKSGSF